MYKAFDLDETAVAGAEAGSPKGSSTKKKKKKRRTKSSSPTAADSFVLLRGTLEDPVETDVEKSDQIEKRRTSVTRGDISPDLQDDSVKRKRHKVRSPTRRPKPLQLQQDWSPPQPFTFQTKRNKNKSSPSRPPSGVDGLRDRRKKRRKKRRTSMSDSDRTAEVRSVSSSAVSEPVLEYEIVMPEQYALEDISDSSRRGFGTDSSADGASDVALKRGQPDASVSSANAASEKEVVNSKKTRPLSSNNRIGPTVDSVDLAQDASVTSSGATSENSAVRPNRSRLLSSSNRVGPTVDSADVASASAAGNTQRSSRMSESGDEERPKETVDWFLGPTSSRRDSDTSYMQDEEFKISVERKQRDATSATSSRHAHSIKFDVTSLPPLPMDGMDRGFELLDQPAGGGGDQPVPELKKSESSEVLNLTLHQCARDGDEYNMKILLRHMGSESHIKKKINQYDEDDLTPLHYAARYNFLGVVKLLVQNGADVNRRGEDDVTPLHHAARYRREKKKTRETPAEENADEGADDGSSNRQPGLNGIPLLEQYESEFGQAQESVIVYLISKGAQVNAVDIYGQTPLHFAAMRGNEVACRDLLGIQGVDIEAQDKQGISPLHMAAIHNQVEIAHMLLEKGGNLRCIDDEQSTPLHHACAEGNVELVNAFFEAGAKTPEAWVMISNMVTDQDCEGSTCLHLAVDNGHYEVAKMCLEKRAEVNRPRKHYMYPLHLAATTGDIRIARLLVENSARIDVVNDEQATALHKAASLNHTEVVKFLVDRGARINRRDKDNFTPLLLAATYGHVETVELLLQKGADYTAVDKYDKTAIYLAAEENKLAVLEKLLSYPQVKRLINVSDQYDNSPLHIAAQQGYLDIVKVLLSHGADLDFKNEEEQGPVHLAAKFGRTNIVREIVRMDKSVLNDEDENSNTALHLAAQYGHNKVADVLLELGADVSARNYNQWTPLDLAAQKGWTKTCSVLLNNDAPVDPTDKNKTTPLHLAARYGHPRVVELLLDWDADVTLEDTVGNNCLDLAIENNHSNVAMRIVNSSEWQRALRNSTEDPGSGRIDTPMRKLIKRMPDVAERVFDRCLSYGQETNPERRGYEITFSYEFLDDTYMPWINEEYRKRARSDDTISLSDSSSMGSAFDDDDRLLPTAKAYSSDSNYLKKNHPLFIMVNSEREELLDHPLVTSLLNHKWNTFGRFFYYLSLFIYCIFLVFLTGFIVQSKPPQNYNSTDRKLIEDNTCSNLSQGYSQDLFSKIGTYVIIALAAFNLLKELLQIYQAKLAYLGWINLIEWTTYITALLLVISFNECQRTTGYRYEWQWSIGAISVFLAWINLVLFIQKFPQLGIYVVMFTDVLYTFAQFFVVFFLFIVAFALAFYTVFQQQDPFSNVPKSLVKTAVMMIGEFEFDAIFNEPGNEVFYTAVSYILFVVFLVVMSIILMNLLVGLAVDDIKAVQEQAALKRMAMQVELALDVERVIPDFIRRKAFIKRKTIRPNDMFKNPITRFFFTQAGLTTKSLQEHLNPELDEIEKVQEGQEKLSGDVKKLKRTVKDLKETSQRIESMMRAVIRANRIDWQDEDYQEEDEVEQIEAGLSY